MNIDLSEIIRGKTGAAYAHEYDAMLCFFKLLGSVSEPIQCSNVPFCWEPFVRYLGHEVTSTARVKAWGDAELVDFGPAYKAADDKRRLVEIASTCRPELVHGLYCADTEWPCPLKHTPLERQSFLVTCNGSFFRPEVKNFIRRLRSYTPPGAPRRAVIVPCAATKPYPAPLHLAVQTRLPAGWQVIVATGVLGLVPDDLWSVAPHYDSGLPNIDRVAQTARWFFSKHFYERLVVYSDFYAYAVHQGIGIGNQCPGATEVEYVLGSHYRDSYENLMLPEHLDRLETAVQG